MKDTCKGELFQDVVFALEQAGYDLCVLHGYEDYPDHIKSDIDALSKDPTQIPGILWKGKAGTVVQAIQTQQTSALWFALYKWCGDRPVFLRLHVFRGDYCIAGRTYFKGGEFLENHRRFKFFRVPPPALEFAAYLVKRVAKRSIDEEQGKRLSKLYAKDPAGCGKYLNRLLPEEEARLVVEAAQKGNWDMELDRIEHLYESMKTRMTRRQPLTVLRNLLSGSLERLRRTVRPPGLMVSFLGVDGAGKSTVMDKTERDLAPAFWTTKRYHGRALESPLRWTKRVRMQRQLRNRELESAAANPHAMPVSRDPHNKPSRGLAISLIKLGVWWADFTFLGYARDIYPSLRRSTLVMFDRYYQDLLVDPRRHRYGGPLWMARGVGRIFPRPHVTILLDASPEVLHSRKQEVSLEETARQREAYLQLVRKLPNGHVVDASRPVREVVANVERILLDHLATRVAKQLKR